MTKLSRTDLIFLLLYASDAPSGRPAPELRGITRLEKLLYLWQKEGPVKQISDNEYEFEAHNFGPFSKDIYDDIELLTTSGFVEERVELWSSTTDYVEAQDVIGADDDEDTEPRERIFRLTDDGRAVAQQLLKQIPQEEWEKLTAIKRRYTPMTLTQLIRYVYRKYPEFTHRSKLKHLRATS